MFTGIVEEVGSVTAITASGAPQLTVGCRTVLDGTRIGDSINVNGCCLTVTTSDAGQFTADMMGETLARTALGNLQPHDPVNLERAMPMGGRLGGHLVQGHVDAVAELTELTPQTGEFGDQWTVLRATLPPAVAPYVAEKGSITLDGVSLTVMAVDTGSFTVGLIPHTLSVTTLGTRKPGDRINVEADVIAKYVERLVTPGGPHAPTGAS